MCGFFNFDHFFTAELKSKSCIASMNTFMQLLRVSLLIWLLKLDSILHIVEKAHSQSVVLIRKKNTEKSMLFNSNLHNRCKDVNLQDDRSHKSNKNHLTEKLQHWAQVYHQLKVLLAWFYWSLSSCGIICVVFWQWTNVSISRAQDKQSNNCIMG